jgi:hypothetical protein
LVKIAYNFIIFQMEKIKMADTNWVVVGESEVVWGTNVVDDEENTCACVICHW